MYVVIMAGGGGTRLWPLSSPERPKPFLPLLGDRSLLQMTVDRLLGGDELDLGPADIAVVTDRRYAVLVRAQLPGATVLEEPLGRNTAAAVALAAIAIDRPAEEVMVVLPADHRIHDDGTFRGVLDGAAAVATAEPDTLVTLGIEPSGPESGYGYIVATDDRREVTSVRGSRVARFAVARFVEKPPRDVAEALIGGVGQASWNAGIFVWRRDAILAALDRFADDIVEAVRDGILLGRLEDAYAAVRPTSIDYAVMEPASVERLVRVVQMNVGWSDLGSWTALLEALGGVGEGRVVQPGEEAEAGSEDLIVERVDGRLVLRDGPRGILAETPVALLSGSGPARDVVSALLDRCSRSEG